VTVGRFTSARNLAARLILKNGEKSTHVRVVDTPGAQAWRQGSSAETRTVVDAAWFEFDQDRINGDLIRTGDREVFIPATALGTVVPDQTTDYMVRVDGSRWQVISVGTIQPNEDLVLHILQVRQT